MHGGKAIIREMKTQIITLESHDDLVSVQDRMSWAKSPRILLVWPGFQRIVLRPVDLRILQHHAHYLGAQIGVVTRWRQVRRDAERFGIPVFESSAAAQRRVWPSDALSTSRRRTTSRARPTDLRAKRDQFRRQEARWRSHPAVRVLMFGLGVAAALSIVALFVPRALIKFPPITMEQSLTLPIEASTSNVAVSIAGRVPAHEMSTTVTGTQSTSVTTQARIPEGRASGYARFTNIAQAELVVRAGTVVFSVSRTAERFVTVNEARIAAKLNASVDVPIQALQSGEAGNMPANSIQGIEGIIGASASVTNPEPTSGGSDRLAVVPSEGDRRAVRDNLVRSLQAQAQVQLAGAMQTQDVLLPNTLKMGAVEEEAYDPAPDESGNPLTLKMRVRYIAQYVEATDLNLLAETSLDSSLPTGYRAAPLSLHFNIAETPVSDRAGTTHLDLQIRRRLVRELDVGEIQALVRGLTPAAAARVLQSKLLLSVLPSVQLSPSWWPWLPLIPFRITVSAP